METKEKKRIVEGMAFTKILDILRTTPLDIHCGECIRSDFEETFGEPDFSVHLIIEESIAKSASKVDFKFLAESLEVLEGLTMKVGGKKRPMFGETSLLEFFKRLPVERMEGFLESSLASRLSPTFMARIMDKKNAPVEARRALYRKCAGSIKFGFDVSNEGLDVHCYGSNPDEYEVAFLSERSFFREFPDREKLESEVTDKWKAAAEEIVRSSLDRFKTDAGLRKLGETYPMNDPRHDAANEALYYIKVAAENGILLEEAGAYLQLVNKIFDEYTPGILSGNYRSQMWRRLHDAERLVMKLGGIRPSGITSVGLEFAPSPISGEKGFYFNGEFLGNLEGVRFSERPCNKEVIAWLSPAHRIDHSPMRGSQYRDEVYAWKPGWKEAEMIFEDHAYTSERSVSVYPPEVGDDGKVTIRWRNGQGTKEKKLTV